MWTEITAVLLASVTGLAVWYFRSYLESIRKEKEEMQEARRKSYMKILNPYISLFANGASKAGQEEIIKEIISYNYRQAHFEFNLIGSDKAVKAMNQMVQHSRELELGNTFLDQEILIRDWGNLLVAIRKDLGNRKTKLNKKDMLIAHIKDVDIIM